MVRGLLYFVRLSLYWMLFFFVYRILFLFIYPGRILKGEITEALYVFIFSIRIDMSTIAYLICFPAILWGLQQFIKKNFLNLINHFYNIVLIVSLSAVCIANIVTYESRGRLISFNTLYYLISPSQMFPLLSTFELIAVTIGFVAIIAVFILLFRVMILMVMPYATTTVLRKIVFVSLVFPTLFIFMRGGLQPIPINESSAYYSDTEFLNHVSVNPAWYLGKKTLLAFKDTSNTPDIK